MASKRTICFFIFIKTVALSLIVLFSSSYFSRVKSASGTTLPYPQTVAVVEVPLLEASAVGQTKRIKELIHGGHSVNVADQDGNSPLIFALWNCLYPQNQEAVEILLKNQADARHRNRAGQAVIQNVLKIDDKEMRLRMMTKVIKFGGILGDMDLKGYDILQKNVETYDTIITAMILDWLGAFITPDILARAKKRALSYNMRDVFDVLDKGPRKVVRDAHWDPMIIDKRIGLSDLHCAVINNDKGLVDTIVQKKRGDINQQSEDEYGMRPLHYGVLHYHIDLVKHMLNDLGAQVRATDYAENTPLHMVTWLTDIEVQKEMVDALLATDKNLVNGRNAEGNTLLHILIYNNNQGLINHVLSKYAPDKTIKNNDNESCFDLAKRLDRQTIITQLKK